MPLRDREAQGYGDCNIEYMGTYFRRNDLDDIKRECEMANIKELTNGR